MNSFAIKRLTYLKVKIKSLAVEAQIIRKEENKCIAYRDEETLTGLMDHRKKHIRPISREANLAYGFLRGTPYRKVEVKSKKDPIWENVDKNLMKFGPHLKKWDGVNKKWVSPYTEALLLWRTLDNIESVNET